MPRERSVALSTSGRILIVTALLLITSAYLKSATGPEVVPPRQPLAQLPMTIGNWEGRREADFTPDVIAVLGVDDYIVRTYFKAGQPPAGVYIGYHSSQRQGDSIHSPLNCLPGAGWEPLSLKRLTLPLGTPDGSIQSPIEVNSVVIGKGLDRNVVLYWYQSHRRVVASEYWGKVYTVLDSVRYHRTDAALVRVIMPVRDGGSVDAVEQDAINFVKELFPLLPKHLPS